MGWIQGGNLTLQFICLQIKRSHTQIWCTSWDSRSYLLLSLDGTFECLPWGGDEYILYILKGGKYLWARVWAVVGYIISNDFFPLPVTGLYLPAHQHQALANWTRVKVIYMKVMEFQGEVSKLSMCSAISLFLLPQKHTKYGPFLHPGSQSECNMELIHEGHVIWVRNKPRLLATKTLGFLQYNSPKTEYRNQRFKLVWIMMKGSLRHFFPPAFFVKQFLPGFQYAPCSDKLNWVTGTCWKPKWLKFKAIYMSKNNWRGSVCVCVKWTCFLHHSLIDYESEFRDT